MMVVSYYQCEMFMRNFEFPITSKEFNYVMKSIPEGLKQLMKSHIRRETPKITDPIIIDGIALSSYKYNNTFIRNVIQLYDRTKPACKFYWDAKYPNIHWQTAWLTPFKYCK